MVKIKLFLLSYLIAICYLPVPAQTDNIEQIALTEQLQYVAENAPPEIIYIQTSKDIFEAGEDLWFKVYLLNAQYLTPSLLSTTLYLQMLDENTRKVVWQEKYEIRDGFADGRIYLERGMPEGEYLITAYTPKSFYKDPDEFYSCRKIIVGTSVSQHVSTDTTAGKSNIPVPGNSDNRIQFTAFPEGGNLVSGIQSRLAFKAVNTRGEPLEVEGILFKEDLPLLHFVSTHAGMGSFLFTPEVGKHYHIRLSAPDSDSIFSLPEIYPSGMVLRLAERDKDSLTFIITQSPGLKPQIIYLRIQCRGLSYGVTTAKLSGEMRIKIPVSNLPQGTAEATLFNSRLVPMSERLLFVNPDRKLDISARLSKEKYNTREKAMLKITVKDDKGKPMVANLGVSVFDRLYQSRVDSTNILSHCYLTSQLRGRIYNPSFYFNSNSPGLEEALDLLMLTQGWRKYVWNEINLEMLAENKQPIISDEIRGELFSLDENGKIPEEQAFVMAFSLIKEKTTIIPTDMKGRFIISCDLLKAYSPDFAYLKPWGPNGFLFNLRLNDPFETIHLALQTKTMIIPEPRIQDTAVEMPDLSLLKSDVILIREVAITAQQENTIRGRFFGELESNSTFDNSAGDDYVCKYNVLNCPNHVREFGWKVPVIGNIYYVYHGVNVVEEVYRSSATPSSPKLTEEELLRKNNISKVKAYYGHRMFYQPNYDEVIEDMMVPDNRNTLLWEPSVVTDANGEATLSFYCSDINTGFTGRVEGVGGGLLGTGGFMFNVRKTKLSQ